jgi:phosphatidylglycerophosphatase A
MGRLPEWLVKAVAEVLWIGELGPAPGTLGALVGTVFFAVCLQDLSGKAVFFAILALLIVGWLFCDEAERRIGRHDPGCVIFDEFAAMPIVFIGLEVPSGVGARLVLLLAGFALFRVFDIAKPFGISRIQDLPGGLGIMADDVVAAIVCCAILHIGVFALSAC